jgi:uncharacterized membrane protein
VSWIFFATFGYFLQSLSVLGDKIILGKILPKPASYAFWQGVLSLGVLVLVPFGFSLLPAGEVLVSFLAGGFWVFGLFFFFKALRFSEASRVLPVVLGLTPLFLFILESYLIGTPFGTLDLFSGIILIVGSVFLSRETEGRTSYSLPQVILRGGSAALFFGSSLFLMKELFLRESFLNVFIWSRLGLFLGSLFFVIQPRFRAEVFKTSKVLLRPKASLALVAAKLLGALGALFIFLSIFRGPVTLVNALQGLQYAFLFILAILLTFYCPGVIKESLDRRAIFQKIVGIILVSAGTALLAFSSYAAF